MKKQIVRVLVLWAVSLFLLMGCGSAQAYLDQQIEKAGESDALPTLGETNGGAPEDADACCVHVSGAVAVPGVYVLGPGSRLIDAVNMAGGFTEEADEDYLNLAAVVADGQQYHVPTKEETEGLAEQSGVTADGLVDINRAGAEELMSLTGIGPGKAQAILEYREEHGSFASTEELMNVSGIGESSFNKLRDEIVVR
ncbi:MAG: helix-hairpin-helix domain-containing protein [Lachnospiraceae bacterium]|nr:helix-hairpin-helix domain-containing protein [Lachnospiraceae bacterium]